MTSHNIPDWVSAVVGVVALAGVGVGGYVGLSNLTAELNAKDMVRDKQIDDLDKYQTFLQQQVDTNRDNVTVLKVKTDTIEKGQEKFADSVDSLAKEIRTMNSILIKLQTTQELKDG